MVPVSDGRVDSVAAVSRCTVSGFANGTDYRMSLKAKLEAVIYAAEEPVTLTQLATLFAAETLEWKAAQEAASAHQAAGTIVDPSQTLLGEGLEYLELRTEDGTLLDQPGFAVLPVADSSDPADLEQASEQRAEPGTDDPVSSSGSTLAASGSACRARH